MLLIGFAGMLGASMVNLAAPHLGIPPHISILLSGGMFPLFILTGLQAARCGTGKTFSELTGWRDLLAARPKLKEEDGASETPASASGMCMQILELFLRIKFSAILLFAVTQVTNALFLKWYMSTGIQNDLTMQQAADMTRFLLEKHCILAILMFLELVVFTPLAEEIFYRASIPMLLRNHGMTWLPAIFLSSAIFALAHSPGYLIPSMFVFAILQHFYQRRHGTFFAVLTHSIYNLVIFFMLAMG